MYILKLVNFKSYNRKLVNFGLQLPNHIEKNATSKHTFQNIKKLKKKSYFGTYIPKLINFGS
jgi:hypothetical protein